jgi:hypothetical protein
MTQSPRFTEQHIIDTLQEHGRLWRDYILVGTPPSVCLWTQGEGLSALIIEDDALWHATIEFLKRHGARSFATMEAVKREFDWDGVARVQSET